MTEYFQQVVDELEVQLKDLTYEEDNFIVCYEKAISTILKEIVGLKKYILEKGFMNEQEEILFFKRLKPVLLSKLIYYNTIYKIETKKPFGGDKTIKKYLHNELAKLKRYFDNNLDFYKYYRTNSTYLDHKYFLRGKHDIKLSLDTFYFEADHYFSTSHDYKVAKILANDLIQVYLEDQLYNTNRSKKQVPAILNWTGSKTALTELIYALHSQGAFDNGNADIKVVAKTFETVFNVDLGDFYHTFMELKSRKINRTKFIDSLRDALIRKMDELDEQ
ncbi:RteC domain-containing protein [Sphingobacterium siyangense]|uniref:RteC protein n=1 Tax=Sphingobacterium siyangense TaxID=459529 RepID=A0A562MFY8_9SPHI|nr:RteC domain-containing protein [Sphingobacterium siyangense]TWI18806.1 RteC protein [Sphingobacterium siyangense]